MRQMRAQTQKPHCTRPNLHPQPWTTCKNHSSRSNIDCTHAEIGAREKSRLNGLRPRSCPSERQYVAPGRWPSRRSTTDIHCLQTLYRNRGAYSPSPSPPEPPAPRSNCPHEGSADQTAQNPWRSYQIHTQETANPAADVFAVAWFEVLHSNWLRNSAVK